MTRGPGQPAETGTVEMQPLTDTRGQTGLPRYFAPVFDIAQRLDNGRLDVMLPDGRIFRAQGTKPGPAALVEVHEPESFARLVREGDLGFADAYLEGWWSTPDLQAFMDLVMGGNANLFEGYPAARLVMLYERLRHLLRGNSKRQARRNIAHHYDLGNDFYAEWLDETMTYSSGLFLTGQEDLARAQRQKYAALADRLDMRPGEHVLEIGCGWGGFAEYAAAERGLRVTGLTISRAQHDYAVARVARAGLSDRVEIKLCDYRDARGQYDGVASIEMFEAVGEPYWPVFFETLKARLKPGRLAALQVITIAEKRFEVYRKGVDFMQKYIFPGGMVPSAPALRAAATGAGLELRGSSEFGESYSETLRRWHASFNGRWESIRQLGFDERFLRMWNYYLCSCAAAFRGGNCDVTQITFARPA